MHTYNGMCRFSTVKGDSMIPGYKSWGLPLEPEIEKNRLEEVPTTHTASWPGKTAFSHLSWESLVFK